MSTRQLKLHVNTKLLDLSKLPLLAVLPTPDLSKYIISVCQNKQTKKPKKANQKPLRIIDASLSLYPSFHLLETPTTSVCVCVCVIYFFEKRRNSEREMHMHTYTDVYHSLVYSPSA